MAKRFTDTNKWDDEWFLELEPAHKLLWIYILDTCDHAGVWKVNFKKASFCIGALLDKETSLKALKGRVADLGNGKWFIEKFIPFQNGEKLNENNNAHKGILKLLKFHNIQTSPYLAPNKPLATKSIDSLGDKVKVQVKVKDKVKVNNFNNRQKISFSIDDLIQLFNKKLANQPNSKIGFCHGLSGDQLREFITTTSFENFQSIETWREIFHKVSKSDFLKGNNNSGFCATLNWLVVHKNALNVLNGQYAEETNEKPSNLAQESKTPITPDNLTGNPYKAKLAKLRSEGKLA